MADKNKIFQLLLDFTSFKEESTILSIILVFKLSLKLSEAASFVLWEENDHFFNRQTTSMSERKKKKRSSEENKNPILKKTIYNII